MGHEPVLSEYPNFPVSPNLNTVENCKAVVRSCDLFVLIVGGRRGSSDPASGKSITNLEYNTAIDQGISCLVFVNDVVMTLLPVWRKNPAADFTPGIDDPQVFRFVDAIASDQKWIFRFSKASEIAEVLRNQLSVFLKTLLDRSRAGHLEQLREFHRESKRAQEIATGRSEFWEYLLTAELFRSKLSRLKQDYRDFQNGLIFKATTRVNALTYFDLIGTKMDDMSRISGIIGRLISSELMESWGPPGEPGDPQKTLRAVDRIVGSCKNLLETEVDISALVPPVLLEPLAATLRGLSEGFIDELARIPVELEAAVQGAREGVKSVEIKLVFNAPPQINAFLAEIERVKQHPEWLMG